jgi:hypothetical protein
LIALYQLEYLFGGRIWWMVLLRLHLLFTNNVFHKKPEKIIFSKVLGVNSSAKKGGKTQSLKQFLTFFFFIVLGSNCHFIAGLFW